MHGVVGLRLASLVLLGTSLAACGGGGLSDVGDQPDLAPIAVATVIGGGANNTVRSGSVVVLSSKDSDGQDSPILRTQWVANDPSVRLEERTANSVAFEAPNVAQATDFSFTVTVFDAEDQPSSDTITLTVVPAQDLNKFLTIDGTGVGNLTLSSVTDFQKFTVRVNPVAAMDPVAPGDTFTVTVDATLNYADRNAACAVTAPANPNQCLSWTNNAILQLAGAGYPLSLAGVAWNASAGGFAVETLVEVDIPAIDASLFNQLLIDAFPPGSDETARVVLLDPWRADTAEITLTITLTSPIAAVATVGGPGSSTIPLGPANDVTVSQILADGSDTLQIESRATAAAYYAAIDPGDDYLTLTDWLVARGFATRAADGSANVLQAASDGSGEFAHAIYANNFDLGFGRDMFTRVDDATGNVYAFVTNYPTLQGTIEGRDEFVTVVMEYSPPGGLANDAGPENKFTKFLVYAIDEDTGEQVRVRSIDFDGRGLKNVPGVCIACHGGTVPTKGDALAAGGYLNQGDTGAVFFPFDLESFLYSDTDAAIPTSSTFDDVRTLDDIDPQRQFTRSAQEDQFRKLNMAVRATHLQSQANEVLMPGDPSRFATVIELVNIWYPGAVPQPQPADCNSFACLVGTFTDGAVPSGWSSEAQLYTDVYARHCRACHSQIASTLIQFATSADFLANTNNGDMVFRTGVMPLARLTMDRLWAGTDTADAPIDILRNALPDVNNEIPGGPVARSEFAAVNAGSVPNVTASGADFLLTKTGRTVDMTGEDSLFFDSLAWSLAAASSVPEFSVCLQDPPALQADGALASLTPTIADDYCVALTASKTDFTDSVADPLLVRAVDDRPTLVQASDCAGVFDGTTCVSVDEFVDPASPRPEVQLGAELFTDPTIPPQIVSLQTTLLALLDEDILDGLDSSLDFRIDFAALPAAGSAFLLRQGGVFAPTTETSFSLVQLLAGDLRYQSDYDDTEILAIPTIDTLNFDVIYTENGVDQVVRSGSAQVLILAKGDNDPVLTIQPAATTVQFSNSISGTFLVTDADVGEAVLAFSSTPAPNLGTLPTVNAPTTIGSTSGDYTYAVGDAQTLHIANGFECEPGPGGGFLGGNAPTDNLTFNVTTGLVTDPTTEFTDSDTLQVTLATSVVVNDVITALQSATLGCSGTSCHGGAAITLNINNIRDSVTLSNSTDPALSTILNDTNVTNQVTPHSGGFPPAFDIGTNFPIVVQWLYECAP